MKLLTALGKVSGPEEPEPPKNFSALGLDIITVIEDPELFGPLFKNQETWESWKVFLRGLFGLGMDEEEQRFFTEHTGRTVAPSHQCSEAFCIAGRRAGKSFISAVVASYLAIFRPWQEYLSLGDVGYIFVVAADRQQARTILGYIKAILALQPFEYLVKAELRSELRLKNNITIEVRTASFRTIRGYTVLAAILDELAFFRDENSANPAQEILTALLPALSTVPGSLLLGISTPYAKSGVLYEAFRAFYGKDEADIPLIWKASTTTMNPCFRESAIRKFFERDAAAARSEYSAEFREDLETYMALELIESLTLKGRLLLPPVFAERYSAFVDVSGGRQDSFTLGVCHKEAELIIIDRIEEVRSPIPNPQDVIKTFCEILHTYRVTQIVGDRYGGNWSSSEFRKGGIQYVDSKIDKNEIYLQFQAICAMHQIRLPDSDRLRLQLQALERRTRSGGKDTIDHPEGLHDDVANACAGAAVHAFQQRLWSAEEMEANLPHVSKSHPAEKYLSPALIEARRQAEKQKSCKEEMENWMMGHEGTHRIIKR